MPMPITIFRLLKVPRHKVCGTIPRNTGLQLILLWSTRLDSSHEKGFRFTLTTVCPLTGSQRSVHRIKHGLYRNKILLKNRPQQAPKQIAT